MVANGTPYLSRSVTFHSIAIRGQGCLWQSASCPAQTYQKAICAQVHQQDQVYPDASCREYHL